MERGNNLGVGNLHQAVSRAEADDGAQGMHYLFMSFLQESGDIAISPVTRPMAIADICRNDWFGDLFHGRTLLDVDRAAFDTLEAIDILLDRLARINRRWRGFSAHDIAGIKASIQSDIHDGVAAFNRIQKARYVIKFRANN